MDVHEADAEFAGELVERGEKFREFRFAARAVASERPGILRDQDELAVSDVHQRSRLGGHGCHGAAAEPAADGRDQAVGAAVVAAVGDLEIGIMLRLDREPGRGLVVNPAARLRGQRFRDGFPAQEMFQHGPDLRVVVDPDPRVDQRVFRLDLPGLVPLRQAARHDDQTPGAAFLPRAGTTDFLHALLPGGSQKCAGVDPHHVRLVVIGGQAESVHEQRTRRHPGVNHVFRASEADEAHESHRHGMLFRILLQCFFLRFPVKSIVVIE